MHSPKHDDVARRAQEIWRKQQCPVGRDNEIWLEAEHQLTAQAPQVKSARPRTQSHPYQSTVNAITSVRHAKADTPPAAEIAFHPIPTISVGESLRAGLQIVEAREPILQTKFAPVAAVPNSGKPLWTRPHSS